MLQILATAADAAGYEFNSARYKSTPKPSRATRHANFIHSPPGWGWGDSYKNNGGARRTSEGLIFKRLSNWRHQQRQKNTVRNISSRPFYKETFQFSSIMQIRSPSLKSVCVCWCAFLLPRFFVPNTNWRRPKVNQSIYFDPILGKLKRLLNP